MSKTVLAQSHNNASLKKWFITSAIPAVLAACSNINFSPIGVIEINLQIAILFLSFIPFIYLCIKLCLGREG